MKPPIRARFAVLFFTLAAASPVGMTGCRLARPDESQLSPVAPVFTPNQGMPRELSKTVLPTYRIEPPDVLVIGAVRLVPRPPYYLQALDVLNIQVVNTLPDEPIMGPYVIQPGGFVELGYSYGSVRVVGLTVEQAREVIREHLSLYLREPVVSVSLAQIAGLQQIEGEHLVGPDGTVTLGTYGSVLVVGMTLVEAKQAIEAHLAQFLENPEVSVDVFSYNSKVYYIIAEGAGTGDRVYRLPITGNETVLDAISHINGLESISSKRMWIARPSHDSDEVQVLPVDWKAITAQASTASNYQILPGDRIFIAEDEHVALDTYIAKVTAPWERVMGFVLLGTGTATRLSGRVLEGGGNPQSSF